MNRGRPAGCGRHPRRCASCSLSTILLDRVSLGAAFFTGTDGLGQPLRRRDRRFAAALHARRRDLGARRPHVRLAEERRRPDRQGRRSAAHAVPRHQRPRQQQPRPRLARLALDPLFESNGYVYLLYVYEEDGNPSSTAPKTGRLTRVQADPSNPDVALPGETVILGTISSPPCSNHPAGSDCIGFDSDSHSCRHAALRRGRHAVRLDRRRRGLHCRRTRWRCARRTSNSYNGKILRINPDGSAPAGQPVLRRDGLHPLQGLRLRPAQPVPLLARADQRRAHHRRRRLEPARGGQLRAGQELRLAVLRRRARAARVHRALARLREPRGERRGFRRLHLRPRRRGQPSTGGVVYSGPVFPAEYQGKYFFADYSANWMRYGTLDASGVLQDVQPFATDLGGPGRHRAGTRRRPLLRRVQRPARCGGSATRRPPRRSWSRRRRPRRATRRWRSSSRARARRAPTAARSPTAGTSATAPARPLPSPAKTYTRRRWPASTSALTVNTSGGGTASRAIRVVVGSTPPSASITSPAPGAAAVTGQTIGYSATGSDPDQALPDAAFSWQILLHHENHVHVESTASGRSGSFVIGDHGIGNYYYELVLTVTDSSGLSVSRNVRTAQVTSAGAYRINAGGPAYTDTLGQLWSADTGFNTGNAASTGEPDRRPQRAALPDGALGPAGRARAGVRAAAANGSYRVNLTSPRSTRAPRPSGARVFDVFLEGTRVLQGLDIFKEVGFEKPLAKSFTVDRQRRRADHLLRPRGREPEDLGDRGAADHGDPAPPPPPPPPPSSGPIRVNAGGGAFTDSSGQRLGGRSRLQHRQRGEQRRGLDGRERALYATERWDPAAAPGAELRVPGRLGHVHGEPALRRDLLHRPRARGSSTCSINGTRVLDHLDIFAEVGFMAPLVKTFTVNVTGTELMIDFVHQVENPKIVGDRDPGRHQRAATATTASATAVRDDPRQRGRARRSRTRAATPGRPIAASTPAAAASSSSPGPARTRAVRHGALGPGAPPRS